MPIKNHLSDHNSLSSNNTNNGKNITLSMNNKDLLININDYTIYKEFKNIVIQSFNLNIKDKINIYYFNTFGIKKFITNENEFKKALSQNAFKYYIIKKNSTLLTIPSSDNITLPNKNLGKKYSQKISKTPDKKKLKLKKEVGDIEGQKKNVSEIMSHFASLAFLQNEIPKETYINSAVYVSDLMNKINIEEQKKHPHKFYDPKLILQKPGLLTQASQNETEEKDEKEKKEEEIFVLSIISKILEEKGINAGIYKKNQNKSELNGASLQYLFGGLTEKKIQTPFEFR